MILEPITETASAGTNYIHTTFPGETILTQVNLYNETTPWLKCTCSIGKDKEAGVPNLPLIQNVPQPGDRHVIWRGRHVIEGPYFFVVAKFLGCTLNDRIWLLINYETREPRRWWDC